jgi:MFS family permease
MADDQPSGDLEDLDLSDNIEAEGDRTVDQEEPLLLEGEEEEDKDPDKIPWKLVVPLALLQVVEAFNANALFSYLPYMVVWFGMAPSLDQAGYFGGPLAAAFYLGQFFSSFFWGYASDKYGKRPVLLLGSLGTLISVLCFGFAPNYVLGLVARFLGGLLNGNIGVAKALLGQIATKNTQTKLFGLFGICWGAGAVVASFYGGATAQLADKFDAFKGTIFETFPFLMPNLITAVVSVAALISGYFFIYDPPTKGEKRGSVTVSELKALLKSPQPLLTSLSYGLLGGVTTMMQELLPLWLAATPDRGGFNFGMSCVLFFSIF